MAQAMQNAQGQQPADQPQDAGEGTSTSGGDDVIDADFDDKKED